MLAMLGIDVNRKGWRGGRGQPCEKPDCPRRACPFVPLWKRRECEILDILHQAKKNFQVLIKDVHPDVSKTGGTQATALISVWKRVRVAFRKKGYEL